MSTTPQIDYFLVFKMEAAATTRGMPADRGLTGLGLLMQLGGTIFLAYGAYLTISPMLGSHGADGQIETFLVGITSAVRSAYHRAAGSGLLYGSPKGALHKLWLYVAVALVQSCAVFGLLLLNDVPTKLAIVILVALLAWPITLAGVFSTKRFRGSGGLPQAEDMGFESAAALMLVFGLLGCLVSGSMLISLVFSETYSLDTLSNVLWAGVLAMLVARSVLHARAGLCGVQGNTTATITHRGNQYFSFAITASIIVGSISVLEMFIKPPYVSLAGVVMASIATYLLLAWPLALRRFFVDRNFATLLPDAISPRPARDAGLTALGWLLLATGVVSLATTIAAGLLLHTQLGRVGFTLLAAIAGDTELHSVWWSAGLAGLQVIAGFELIRMGAQHRVLTTVFGVVTVLVTCYLSWPLVENLHRLGPGNALSVLLQPLAGLGFGLLAVYLVNRKNHESPTD